MPLDKSLKKVLLIGSGPIVIGQAAEFDYAGTQACRVLRKLGLTVVLVNPNPATIMTDPAVADKIYVEPLTVTVLERILQKEKPDGLLTTIGGQMGLTLSMQLARSGFLAAHGVRMLGAGLATIENAEDRQKFKDTMARIGQPTIPSAVVTDVPAALAFARTIGYPVIVRPAFTLGGSGGGIAPDEPALLSIARGGLEASPIGQILVEKCISGWKEIEFEVMRDGAGNAIAVCSMENFDPVGIHTGDSIVVAPTVTLADPEFQMLRSAALAIIGELGVEGGCNVQFALHPERMEYAVIEVNPRVSRSSALASKATGYPIAKVAAQIAVGLRLDEIPNDITQKTTAFFEPALDYVVVKFPKWPFDKFVTASRTLGTQMKATGEVMSIAPTFEQALLKALRGAEIRQTTLSMPKFGRMQDAELCAALQVPTDERLFAVYEGLKRGYGAEKVHALTGIDEWFLGRLLRVLDTERALASCGAPDAQLYQRAKRCGFLDRDIAALTGAALPAHLRAHYRMVDTCAAEFEASTPYFYADYGAEDEAEEILARRKRQKRTVLVFGSGPIRIGQGIEFDYASVHCVRALKEMGCDVVMVNNNPETVSTDFDTADRLYFEPLTDEDVLDIAAEEKPYGAVVAFGGQTAINLTKALVKAGVRILGTPADSVDAAEDRERFDAILEKLRIRRAAGRIVYSKAQALAAARELGYPVLVRPSYVLGGKNMILAFSDAEIDEYMDVILASSGENTILVDKYLAGQEVEVDAVCDGRDILIPGIMEHIERAGIHSGDSIAVYPAYDLSGPVTRKIVECTARIAEALDIEGLINIQYVVHNNEVYVIEANPRASRTLPYISKVTGVPVAALATRAMLGERLADMDFGTGLYRQAAVCAVKVPVFSFEKLPGVDTHLGPEMKSTGEVLGIGANREEALFKGLTAAGYRVAASGGVLVTMPARDRWETVGTVRRMQELGFRLYAPQESAALLRAAGIVCETVDDAGGERKGFRALLESGKVQYVLSTSARGQLPDAETVELRSLAVEFRIACLTSVDTANALVSAIDSGYSEQNVELFDLAALPAGKKTLRFVKMRASGSDYVGFDCFEQSIASPESLAVQLTSRRKSIGADGIFLVGPSDRADAAMRMFNADGTAGEVAGNALRCAAKYLYESGRVRKGKMELETDGGVKRLELFVRDSEVYSVAVQMGRADFSSGAVPVNSGCGETIDWPYTVGGRTWRLTCLSMGNPHAVVFVEDPDAVDLAAVGPLLERAPIFSRRANISFVTVIDRTTLRMRIWERGAGETNACGTGACAAAAAAVRLGLCAADTDLAVVLRGGSLVIRCGTEGLTMTGDAVQDYEGTIEAL